MNFAWIAFTLMVAVAAVGITIPLVRRYDARRAAPKENAVLVRELAELDGQAAAEGLPAAEAESLRADTIRRFLTESPADAAGPSLLGARGVLALALGLAAIVAIGATLLYTRIGRPDLAATASAAADGAPPAAADAGGAEPGHVASMVAQLEAKMRQSPNDPEGWRMLGWSYMQTGRFADAAVAYGKASALDPSVPDYQSAMGEALVRAADGHVTPAARVAFAQAIKGDPSDPRARYFLAAARDQDGDHEGAMVDWIALLKSAPPGAPWAPEVRGFVIRIAAQRGEDVSAKLPPLPPPAPGDAQAAAGAAPAPGGTLAGGPAPDQMAAVQQMPPAQQQAMIHNMVDGLAARLKANPNDPDGWVELMRARMVLGDPAAATTAYHAARKAFAAAPDRLTMVSQAAKQLRVPGA
ncbi:MAG TPA: c-type cytochrome biogenesis protein CcmI [Caulobacteraceae bacterium]|nr:c-type cytochrome biogenesis protein CcmI [Caulobacteraceae bacterium]